VTHRASLLDASMRWMDGLWDDDAGLLWTVRRDHHVTRETAWYALGLMQRGSNGDVERAVRAVSSVIDTQFDAPGTAYGGTFRRAPEEPDPPDDPVMWVHYDPNWRQFIGTTFALICDRYSDRLPSELEDRMRRSIAHAVDAEPDDRISPTYANIALMKAWLDTWSGVEAGGSAREIARAFDRHGAFLEYNSPTYYGIDLFALALWRSAPEPLASLGAGMEAALWRDIARFYHAGMRNLCGPYDRAYGMDMTSYASPLGLYIWDLVGAERAPFPDITQRFRHQHDTCFAPCVAATQTLVPPDALKHLTTFEGERTIEQTITSDPERVATAWLSDDVMIGAQNGPPSGIGWYQHHHATIHWLRPDGTVGWMSLNPQVAADATAAPGELRITASSITFDAHPPAPLDGATWILDGLTLDVEADAGNVRIRVS
jgi:hypothetical protein